MWNQLMAKGSRERDKSLFEHRGQQLANVQLMRKKFEGKTLTPMSTRKNDQGGIV